MKGINELYLCDAEMIVAVQYYLNEVVMKAPIRVTKIERKGTDSMFRVVLAPPGEDISTLTDLAYKNAQSVSHQS